VANLPAESDRAGIFHPLASIWSKPPFKYPVLGSIVPPEAPLEKDINYLRKDKGDRWVEQGHIPKAKTRENVIFRPLDDGDSTDSETDAEDVSKGGAHRVNLHPWSAGAGSAASTHSSTPTVLEDGVRSHVGDKHPLRADSWTQLSTRPEGSDLPDYSDHEVDITSDVKSTRHGPDWTPRFFRDKAQLPQPQTDYPRITPPLDGITSIAGRGRPSQKSPRDMSKRHESPRWQAFWRDVNERICHKEIL
jgi:hypothetical protein